MKTVEDLRMWLGACHRPPQVKDHTAVRAVSCDSRDIGEDGLYVAIPGGRVHGGCFAEEARRNGAVVAVSDRPVDGIPTFVVDAPRAILGPLSSWFFDAPSHDLDVIGVTGTNGKTTTSFLLDAGVAASGRRSGLVSTIETRVGERRTLSARTTPEAPRLQRHLAEMRDEGAAVATVEVSSHALAMGRVDATRFAAAVFTNLGHDHLDFHGSMEEYYRTKRMLFRRERCRTAVVNLDDPYGRRLAVETDCQVIGFSRQGRADADWRVSDVQTAPEGLRFKIHGPSAAHEVRLQLLGDHNVDNALGAVAGLHALGVELDEALDGLERLRLVPGRFQRVTGRSGRKGIVDYAHNPDGLRSLLTAARACTDGKVVVVFGAPGDRDAAKRPVMGSIAADLADFVIVTTDDPWSEDPQAIADAVVRGVSGSGRTRVRTVLDREAAIAAAVQAAGSRDLVVVAGRGHEKVQAFRDHEIRFDDVEVLGRHLDGGQPH